MNIFNFAFKKDTEKVRLLHMSDTHMILNSEMVNLLPSADILLHTGDFTNQGTTEEIIGFNQLLGEIAHKYPIRVIIFGNHDCYRYQANFNQMKQLLPNATHILAHEQVELYGIKIYGCPWWFGHSWDYTTSLKQAPQTNFDKIPENFDILMTHGPPFGVMDCADGVPNNFSGSEELLAVVKSQKPKCHLFGHIHEQYGFVKTSDTLFVNSAMKNRWGPHRIENLPQLLVASRDSPNSSWSFALESYTVNAN